MRARENRKVRFAFRKLDFVNLSHSEMKDTTRDRSESLEIIVYTHEYEILDEIRESSISDDEEPGDWTGYSLLLVRLSVLGAARGAAQLVTSASGHQLERL